MNKLMSMGIGALAAKSVSADYGGMMGGYGTMGGYGMGLYGLVLFALAAFIFSIIFWYSYKLIIKENLKK